MVTTSSGTKTTSAAEHVTDHHIMVLYREGGNSFVLNVGTCLPKYKGKSVPLQVRGAQRVPGSWGSQITWQRHRMVVRLPSLRTGLFYPQEILLVLISVRSRPQGHSAIGRIICQWKIPMTPSGIEPATFRFVAQHLNHCATAVPYQSKRRPKRQ